MMVPLRIMLTVTLICASLLSFSQEKVTISGYLTDASNGESLIGATIYINEIEGGAITNYYGYYSISLAPGQYTVQYRSVGYETINKDISLEQSLRKDIELTPETQQLEEVVVTAEPEDVNVSGIEMSTNKLDITTIKKIPAFLGENDVLKAIQLLPGVSTVGEGASGFNVRGGSVGQNLVLLDEAPVYNSSHLFGFFSVFNPDAVKDIKLFKGGIPSRYGGRLSSILDIRMKEGNQKELEVNGGIGTIFSRLAIEAPIVKDKASFIVAGRRSYADLLAAPFTDLLDDEGALNFYDLTMKTNYNINKKNWLFLSGYLGRDKFSDPDGQGFNWGNSTATLRWNHLFNDQLFSNFTFFFSDYDYAFNFGDDERDKFDWSSQIRTFNLKPELTYFIGTNNELNFGGEVLLYLFDPANAVGVSNGETQDVSLDEKKALESAIYIDNNQKISNDLSLRYGLRFSSFLLLGDGTIYEYEDVEPGLRRPPVSSRETENWEIIESFYNFEPRFSIKYQLQPQLSLKASYNRMVQYIHLVSNTAAATPIDVWNPSSNNIKPQKADQYAFGVFKNFGLGNDIETSAEVYFRKARNQIDYIDGADLLINEFLEGDLLSGEGRAYGLELYVKKNTGKLTGWVSYTLARTELNIPGINNGDWYPARYDQTHNLKLAAFYEINKKWSFSTNFSLITGTPVTFPNDRFQVQNYVIPYIADGSRNNSRIPTYHRLDIAFTMQGRKYKKNGERRKNQDYFVFSIYNLYSRRNPFALTFAQPNDVRPVADEPIRTEATQTSIIGTFFPSVSYNFKF